MLAGRIVMLTEVEFSNLHDENVIQKEQWFKSKSDLSWKIRMLACERNFRFTIYKSEPKLLVIKCVDKNCKWKIQCTKKKTCEYFWVTKYIDNHTCLGRIIGPPKASSKVTSKLILDNFRNIGLSMKPNLILTILKKRYGIDSKYWKTWKYREDAHDEVLGSPKRNYAQMQVFIAKIKQANPGTITYFEIDNH